MGFKVTALGKCYGSVVGHASRYWCLVKIVKLLLVSRHHYTLLLCRLGRLLLLMGCGRSLCSLLRRNQGSTPICWTMLYKLLLLPYMMGLLLLLCLLHFKSHLATVGQRFALMRGFSRAWVSTWLLNIGLLHDHLRGWQNRWPSVRRVVSLLDLISCLPTASYYCGAFQANLTTSSLLLRWALLFAGAAFGFWLGEL